MMASRSSGGAKADAARCSRRERVERMAALNNSLIFSILEWGAETNYNIQSVTATVLKYPLEIIEGVYTNLCAAREDWRAKNKFRRSAAPRDDDDPESVTTTTRLQFLEQEIMRLRAAMEKEVSSRDATSATGADGGESTAATTATSNSPVVHATFAEDDNGGDGEDEEASDAAAAAAVAAVAAAMANMAAAQAATSPATPAQRRMSAAARRLSAAALENLENFPSPAVHFDTDAAVADTSVGGPAGAAASADAQQESIRREGLICLQDIRSGVQLRKPRSRRPSKKARERATPDKRRMTIADLIRESNARIGPAVRMQEWSPDAHEDDEDMSPSMAQWEHESVDSPGMASRVFSPVSYSARSLPGISGVLGDDDEQAADSAAPSRRASFAPADLLAQKNTLRAPPAAGIPAPPAAPAPAANSRGGTVPVAPAAMAGPPPPPPAAAVVPAPKAGAGATGRPAFVLNGADFLAGKSALKKAKKKKHKKQKTTATGTTNNKGKGKGKSKAAPKMSLADALLMQHSKVKAGKNKKRKQRKQNAPARAAATPGILGAIQNARSGLRKTPNSPRVKGAAAATDTTGTPETAASPSQVAAVPTAKENSETVA